jgi:membrane protease YdiL (CAAX protease family)
LFGLAQGIGPWAAIVVQAIAFGFAHAGKPPIEMAGAFAGGAILGILCWREKSFVPAFLIHSFVHLTWAILVLR